jgi:hypothetical protein
LFNDPTQRPAPQVTVEALMHGLRSRVVAAVTEPDTKRRLAQLSNQQAIEVGSRLRKLNPEIAAPWTAHNVSLLMLARERFK